MGDDLKESPEKSYSEIFEEQFPQYLAIGMSASEYWDGDPKLVKAYREAYQIRREAEDYDAWKAGCYIYEALCCASPLFRSFGKGTIEARPYREKPYMLEAKEKKQEADLDKQGLKEFEHFKKIAELLNAQRNHQKGGAGQ